MISYTYVINLESCPDRKEHIIEEFKRVGITNYEFFKATPMDSNEVADMFRSGFVKMCPPCFRCNRKECRCSNNALFRTQIGNWCSFINIMKDIIKNDRKGLIMISEDDIKFRDGGKEYMDSLITDENFKKHGITYDKPILIRVEQKTQTGKGLVRTVTMGNPCFIINILYAQSFLRNLKKIVHTSDTYIHRMLPKIDTSIQNFGMAPGPVYELSFKPGSKFNSTVHPRNKRKHCKRVEAVNHFNMYIPNSDDDGIFKSLRSKATWEPVLTSKMNELSKKYDIDTFIDVGAHIGYYTVNFATMGMTTYSFEPDRDNYLLLELNLILNNCKNSNIYNIGISDSCDEKTFYYRHEKSGHGTFNDKIVKNQKLDLSTTITTKRLDDVSVSGNNIMVKIDTEGHELEVINGMKNILESGRIKVLTVEITPKFYGTATESEILKTLNKYFTAFNKFNSSNSQYDAIFTK